MKQKSKCSYRDENLKKYWSITNNCLSYFKRLTAGGHIVTCTVSATENYNLQLWCLAADSYDSQSILLLNYISPTEEVIYCSSYMG